jgi:hypothetical protein
VCAAAAVAVADPASAHGLGGVRNLPIPGWLFLFGGAAVLVVSFIALAVLWQTPRLEPGASERRLPGPVERLLLSRTLRIVVSAAAFAMFVVVWAAAVFGSPTPFENLAPTFVYVVFWLGVVPLVVVLGNVWTVLNPWKAAADAVAWAATRLRVSRLPRARYPERLGRWPAAVLLLAFTALELAFYDPADPRVLAVAILVYSLTTWSGMLLFGREPWFENGDGFSVYFELLSRLAPLAVREREGQREIVLRRPLSGLSPREATPGTVAVVAVMLGSVAFDGFSRTTTWQRWIADATAGLRTDSRLAADLAGTALNTIALVAAVALVAAAYLGAVAAAESVVGRGASLAGVFLNSLIPIALVYAVAHYLLFFLVQGQFAIPLLSDPFGRGWDLIGTHDFQPKLDVLSPNATWYIQVAALVVGHVLALVVAHDRAVAVARSPRTATRTQYAMLALMVVYTVGGMWLLTLG